MCTSSSCVGMVVGMVTEVRTALQVSDAGVVLRVSEETYSHCVKWSTMQLNR